MMARILDGSKFSCVSSNRDRGSAARMRGINRARIVGPVELKAKPVTGFPSRRTSVRTATTDVVISEKSKLELRMLDLSGIAHSRISRILMAGLFLTESC